MKRRILKYTIRVNKRQPSLIEIAIKDWPTYTQPFTFWSQREGHTAASNGYYYRETRPATEEEKKSFESELNQFMRLYSEDYILSYVEKFRR